MNIVVKEIEPCKLSIHYEASPEEILNKRSDVLTAFKKAPVPGFRPGKASADAIRMHYRTQIEDALKRALTEDAYHNTLFEKKLRPHGAPTFHTMMFADGKFTCEFDMHTKPEFELAEFKNMEVPKPHEMLAVTEVANKMLEDLRQKFGEVSPYTEDDFVKSGDNVILDYDGFLNGEKVDTLSAQGEMVSVGKSEIPEFDTNLLGMKLGETREFDMVVSDQSLPSFAGKTVQFKVTVTMGARTEPCGLNNELAKKLGLETFAELTNTVHSIAAGKVGSHTKNMLNEAVCARLVVDNQVDVPNWMALSEAQYLAHHAKLDWNTLPDVDKEKYLEVAAKNVKLALVLDKVRETEPEAQLSDQEVFEIIKRNLAQTKTDKNIDDVIKEMNRTGYMSVLFSRIRDEHTIDTIVKSVKVIE